MNEHDVRTPDATITALRAELADVHAERDAMQSIATQNGRERDRLASALEEMRKAYEAKATLLEKLRTAVARFMHARWQDPTSPKALGAARELDAAMAETDGIRPTSEQLRNGGT